MFDHKQISQTTDDTTLEDEYEMARLDALPAALRELAGLHALDQFGAVPSYLERFADHTEENRRG